jgi:hypothetical protein
MICYRHWSAFNLERSINLNFVIRAYFIGVIHNLAEPYTYPLKAIYIMYLR